MEGPIERDSREEVVKAIREMKVRKAAGPSEVSVEMIAVSGEIEIGVMVELCQGVLDGRRMPDDWALSVVVPIFKRKGDAISCMAYRGVKVLKRRLRSIVKKDEKQFGSMPGKGTIESVFILRRLQGKWYGDNGVGNEEERYTSRGNGNSSGEFG